MHTGKNISHLARLFRAWTIQFFQVPIIRNETQENSPTTRGAEKSRRGEYANAIAAGALGTGRKPLLAAAVKRRNGRLTSSYPSHRMARN